MKRIVAFFLLALLAVMGCTRKVRAVGPDGTETTAYKRICREGPVLMKEEILWDA